MSRSRVALLLIAAAMTLPTSALAEPSDKARAKEAYDRGLEAHKRGDLHGAAEEFARADALAPSPVALQAALDAAIEADDVPLGAELLERSKREPAPPGLASSITAAHLKFSGRAGRVKILCPEGSTCSAKIDERPVEVDKVVWAQAGQRTVSVQVDGRAQTKLVELSSDQVVEVSPSKGGKAPATRIAPLEEEPPAGGAPGDGAATSSGLSPMVFYAGVGLTVVLAGVTTAFALDTASTHGSFEDAGCTRANFAPCAGLKDDGERGQALVNVGLVLTLLSGAATAVVGAAFTNWKAPRVALYPGGGGGASWHLTF